MKVAVLAVASLLLPFVSVLARASSAPQARPHPFAYGGSNLVTYAGMPTDLEGQGVSADAALLEYEWDFEGDGHYDWRSRVSGNTSHVYPSPGHFTAFLRVTRLDNDEATVDQVRIVVRPGAGKVERIPRMHKQRATSRQQLEALKKTIGSRHRLSPGEADFLELSVEGPLGSAPQAVSAAPARALPPDGNAKRYVVMINGGSEARFWDDVTYAYDTFLTAYGIPAQDIYLLNYDGRNPSGLNPDGMIDFAATKANVQAVLAMLGGTVDGDDLLFVWVTDHGRGYNGPIQHTTSQQKVIGYLDGLASVDPGDEADYLEADFKLRALFSGGSSIGGHGMNEWVVLDFTSSSTYYRHKFVSHFTDQYFAVSGATLSDNDIRVEEFVDYLAGDLNKDGKITSGEVKDFDGDGVPPYDPVTRTFDEDDWGPVDTLVDNVRSVNTLVPEGWASTYSIIDLGLDGRVDIDWDFDPAHPELADADGTDVDGDGLFDGLDVNDDGDKSDMVSIDEKICLYGGDMTDDEFSASLDAVSPAATVVVMEQCFSGGFIWDLSRSGRVVMSAAEEETVSYGNVFIRNVNAALEGATVPGSYGDPTLADTNHDGIVDMAEVFQFASANDASKPLEIPQYDDNGDGVSHPDPIPAGGDGPLGSHTSLVQWGGDVTPPLVTDVRATSVTSSSASIIWATSEAATSQVEYGADAFYGLTTTLDPTLTLAHGIPLSGLAPLTTYHYRVRSQDASATRPRRRTSPSAPRHPCPPGSRSRT